MTTSTDSIAAIAPTPSHHGKPRNRAVLPFRRLRVMHDHAFESPYPLLTNYALNSRLPAESRPRCPGHLLHYVTQRCAVPLLRRKRTIRKYWGLSAKTYMV